MSDMNFTFPTLTYTRPDFEAVSAQADAIVEKIKNAASYADVQDAMKESETMSGHVMTQYVICSVRHTIDTRDEFYEEENRFLENTFPTVQPKLLAISEALMESPFRADIENQFGKQIFVQMELQKKSFTEKNIPLMQRDAQICDEYQKIMATAQIPFRGENYNLYGIQKFFEDKDRETRREAYKAYSDFYHSNEPRLEELWAELISVRNEMGRNLGFENFIPLGYLQQGRADYGQKEVEAFRAQVRSEVVPLCEELLAQQKERLGVDELMAYDEKMVFPDGNAQPAGDDDFMIEQARKMYHDLSPETGEFIDFMIDHELLDLKNKPGKASTGYMTELMDYKAPFVFSCFNGTIFDMQVLSHELGHAFAGYMAMKTQPISDYYSETTDIAEIHSMSMEQFAYKYIELFFGDDADKYRRQHLQEAITFVPFGTAVDEFQHICYANPELSPKERTLAWKKLEETYMPWRKYDADDFFDRGGFWYHKLHIFLYPMYYINYCFTTMGAMEFAAKNEENHEAAWADYLNLCKCGGSMSYEETLRYANVSIPYEEGTVAKAMEYPKKKLL